MTRLRNEVDRIHIGINASEYVAFVCDKGSTPEVRANELKQIIVTNYSIRNRIITQTDDMFIFKYLTYRTSRNFTMKSR